MKVSSFVFFFFLSVLTITSCYYDVEEELYPNISGCDTVNVTLSASVKPVLKTYCYACHSTANAPVLGMNIDLENYTTLKIYVDNQKLIKSVKHLSGVKAMPYGSSTKIPACAISKLDKWIRTGAKND